MFHFAVFCIASFFLAAQTPVSQDRIPFQEVADPLLRAELVRVMKALSAAEFERAANIASRVPLHHFKYAIDVSQAPADQRAGIEAALEAGVKAWENALEGTVKFEKIANPGPFGTASAQPQPALRLVLRKGYGVFVPTSSPSSPPIAIGGQQLIWYTEQDGPRQVQATIFTDTGPEGTPFTLEQLTHLAGRAVGCYYGLRPTPSPIGIMGLPTLGQPRTSPSPQEAAFVKKLVSDYLQLVESVNSRKRVEFQAPAIVVENPKVDLGKIDPGQKTGEIHYRNTGVMPLQISVTACCGLSIKSYDSTLEPGESGKLVFILDGARYSGRVTRSFGMNTNDPEWPHVGLEVSALVVRDLATFPPTGSSIDLAVDKDTVHEFFVYSPSGKTFDIKSVVVEPERYAVTYEKGKRTFVSVDEPESGNVEREGYVFKVTIPSTEGYGGPLTGRVSVETNITSFPIVSYVFRMTKGIQVNPGVLHIEVGGGAPTQRVVLVEQNSAPFKIVHIEMSSDELEIKQEVVREGYQYRLWITPKAKLEPGSRAVRILLTTDSTNQPKIPITVWLSVRSE